MSTTNPTDPVRQSPAAQLRATLAENFSSEDLQLLCYDLLVDYDDLPGDSKATKIVSLLEQLGRSNRITQLIDRCAQLRPSVSWDGLRTVALTNPTAFRPAVLDVTGLGSGSLLNLPAGRALRIGIVVGILVMLVLLCGFSGGLLAGRFVNVSFNPVPGNSVIGRAAVEEVTALGSLPSGANRQLVYDNVKATSLAEEILVNPQAPVSEVHIQFLDSGEISLNTRMRALGDRRVIIGMAVNARDGRLMVEPRAVLVDILGLQGTTFGWIPVPTGLFKDFMAWMQGNLDGAAGSYWFNSVQVRANRLLVDITRR